MEGGKMGYSIVQGDIHYNKGEYGLALMHYTKLLEIVKGDDLYKCKYNIATILLKLDYYRGDKTNLDTCINMFKECVCYETDTEKIANRLYQIGVAYIGKENYRRANTTGSDDKYLRKALEYFQMAYGYNSDDKEITKAIILTQRKIIDLNS